MKRFIRCMCLLLMMVMVLSIPAYATETAAPRASSYFSNSSVFLCNVSGNYFEAWFEVTSISRMDTLGVSFIKIQQSSDGSNWTTVKTYTKESYPSLIDNDAISYTAGVGYTAVGGYYYRAHIQLYAKKGVNYGTMNQYTTKIYIPAT